MKINTQSILGILVIAELFIAQQIFTYITLNKNCKKICLLFSDIIIFSALVFGMIYFLPSRNKFINYDSMYSVFQLLFIFPVLFFYKQGLKDKIIAIFMGFTYGTAVFAVAFRCSCAFAGHVVIPATLIIQTAIHICSFFSESFKYAVLHFINNENFPSKLKFRLMTISLTTFFIVISFNTALTRDASQFFKFLCLLLLAVLILMSYRIMFELKNEVSENKDLSRQIKRDKLTGLKNRAAFKEDFRKAVANQSEFSCFFIDLDHFKKINDTYGHPAGDRYIKKFSQQLQIHEDKTSTFYRVSGDEFCCISYNTLHTEHVLRQINKNGLIVDNIPFEGFSYGYSKYPDDSEDATRLIEIADSRMYSNKRSKTRVIF